MKRILFDDIYRKKFIHLWIKFHFLKYKEYKSLYFFLQIYLHSWNDSAPHLSISYGPNSFLCWYFKRHYMPRPLFQFYLRVMYITKNTVNYTWNENLCHCVFMIRGHKTQNIDIWSVKVYTVLWFVTFSSWLDLIENYICCFFFFHNTKCDCLLQIHMQFMFTIFFRIYYICIKDISVSIHFLCLELFLYIFTIVASTMWPDLHFTPNAIVQLNRREGRWLKKIKSLWG